MSETPGDVYTTSPVINAGSTAGERISFGFPARTLVRVYNASTFDLYVDLKGAAASTATSHIVKTLDALTLPSLRVPLGGLAVHTTTTAAAGARVSILAVA